MQQTKTCRDCGETKSLEMFGGQMYATRIGEKRYYHPYCKACKAKAQRAEYHDNSVTRAKQQVHGMNANKRVRHLPPIPVTEATEMLLTATECFYCGQPNDGVTPFSMDHHIPLKLGGPHTLENLRPCCEPCNRAKHDSHPDEYLAWLRGVIERGKATAK